MLFVGNKYKIKSYEDIVSVYGNNLKEDDVYGFICKVEGVDFIKEMSKYCDETVTISKYFYVDSSRNIYYIKEDNNDFLWSEKFFELNEGGV